MSCLLTGCLSLLSAGPALPAALLVAADGANLASVPLAADLYLPGQFFGGCDAPAGAAGYWLLPDAAWPQQRLGARSLDGSSQRPQPLPAQAGWLSFTFQSAAAAATQAGSWPQAARFGDSHNHRAREWRLAGPLAAALTDAQSDVTLCDQGAACGDLVAGDGILSRAVSAGQRLDGLSWAVLGAPDASGAPLLCLHPGGWALAEHAAGCVGLASVSAEAGQQLLVEVAPEQGWAALSVSGNPLASGLAQHRLGGAVLLGAAPVGAATVAIGGTSWSLRADAAGGFDFGALPSMGYVLLGQQGSDAAPAAGAASGQVTLRHLARDRQVALALAAPGAAPRLAGTVWLDGQPRPGAQVLAWTATEAPCPPPGPGARLGLVGEGGSFALASPAGEAVCLAAAWPGHEPAVVFLAEGQSLALLELGPAGTCDLQLGWQVEDRFREQVGRLALAGRAALYYTRPSQGVRVPATPLGIAVVWADMPGLLPAVQPILVAAAACQAQVRSTALEDARFSVSGSLLSLGPEPLPDTYAVYLRTETRFIYGEGQGGSYVVPDVPVGRWPLTIEAAGFIKHVEDVAVLEGDVAGLAITLVPLNRVAVAEPKPDGGCAAAGGAPCIWTLCVLGLLGLAWHRGTTRRDCR